MASVRIALMKSVLSAAPIAKNADTLWTKNPLIASSIVLPAWQNHRSPFRLSRSAFRYDDGSKNLILSFKFMDKTENAKVLGRWAV